MNKDQTKGEVVNIGSTEEHTVTEYAHMVKKITGSSSTIVYKESLPTHDPKQRKADITKAKRLLDWSPTTPLEEGLSKTVEYVQVVLKK